MRKTYIRPLRPSSQSCLSFVFSVLISINLPHLNSLLSSLLKNDLFSSETVFHKGHHSLNGDPSQFFSMKYINRRVHILFMEVVPFKMCSPHLLRLISAEPSSYRKYIRTVLARHTNSVVSQKQWLICVGPEQCLCP